MPWPPYPYHFNQKNGTLEVPIPFGNSLLPPEAQEQARVQEQQAKAAAKRQEDLQHALEDERHNQEERIKRMEEKMEEEKRLHSEELDRALESKLREQKEMLEKGFKDKAEIMGQEIEQLKREKVQKEADPGFFKKYVMPAFEVGKEVLSTFLQYKLLRRL